MGNGVRGGFRGGVAGVLEGAALLCKLSFM